MSITPFTGVVTTTKKNNRYYGTTESKKMASFLSELSVDINTISDQINYIRTSVDAMASGYLDVNGYTDGVEALRREICSIENRLSALIDGSSSASTLA
jgi:hypothetical protein